MVDYYAVLEVRPEANYQVIFKAYRRLAAKYHPDRGGSHEDMVRINEAWYILSDTERRRAYDQARSEHATDSQAEQYREDLNDARKQASQYPETWADFLRWLNAGVKEDVQGAKYNMSGGLLGAPTIEESLSGVVAMILCVSGVYGWLLRAGSYDPLFTVGLKTLFHNPDPDGRALIYVVIVPIAGGLWLGYWLHLSLRMLFPTLSHNYSSKDPKSGSAKRVLHCDKCKKSLRVPDLSQTLVVTCPVCGNRFEAGGGQRPPKNNGGSDTDKSAQGLIVTLAIGVFCLAGVLAGTYKVFFVGFDPEDSKDTAQAQYDRLRLIGTWEETTYATAADLGVEANDAFESFTISGTSNYESDGSFSFVGEYVIHPPGNPFPNNNAGLAFSFKQDGGWSIENDSGQSYIHYKISEVALTPFGDNARVAVQQNPQAFQHVRQELLEDWSSKVTEWSYSELRTKDVDFGIETKHRRTYDR